MAYTKQSWADGDATKPLSAARMTVIENGIEAAHADRVRGVAGSGELIIVREGIDNGTGAANEITLSTSGGSGGTTVPPGYDIDGGIIGGSLADYANMPYPASTSEDETYGRVLQMATGSKTAVRVNLYSSRIDKVSWYVLEGSATGIGGSIAIYNATNNAQLAFTNTVNISPVSVPSPGVTQTWTLGSALTGLTISQVVVVFQLGGSAANVRLLASGSNGFANQTALRTSGTLHRSGQITSGGTTTSGDTLNATATTWNKKPIANVILQRTT